MTNGGCEIDTNGFDVKEAAITGMKWNDIC